MAKSLDRLTLLETFLRICERGSISAAARDLGLSQPSVSRQLADLEGRFGAQLVHRTTHRLAITPAGSDLLQDARQLVADWEALEERHGRGVDEVKGRLKVVAPVALGQLHLVDAMLRFQADHPGVSVIWELDDAPIRFAESGCDCWIKIGPVPDENLVVRPVAQVERLVVAAKSLASGRTISSPRDVEALPFAVLEPFEGKRITLTSRDGGSCAIRPDAKVSTNNIFALYRSALQGAGVAVLPHWFVSDDLEEGRLVDILPGWRAAELDINIAYLPGRHQPLRLRKFIAHMQSEIPAIPAVNSSTTE